MPPLSANLQNYSLSGFSPMQDGRLGSEPATCHSQHGSQAPPFRERSVMPEVTILTHFRFLSAGGTVGCWVRGARWILTFAPASCTRWTSGREAPPTPSFLLGAAEGCGFGEGETVNPLGRLAGTG